MKFRKRLIISGLLAGLIISISSCRDNGPTIDLLNTTLLASFPSASAIEYSEGRFYLLGDDASYMLVLDSSYRQIDTVRMFHDTSYRIPTETKADIESAAILNYNGKKFLYALSSFSAPNRKKLFYFPLSNIHDFLEINADRDFILPSNIPEINFEGLAIAHSKFIIANRGNATHRMSQLIIAGDRINDRTSSSTMPVIDIILDTTRVISISGLCYSEEEDKLFFTASEEDTPNALQDGKIGNSYIGWIDRFSIRMNEKSIRPDGWISLAKADTSFINKKIESICIEKATSRYFLIDLVADNDNGQSLIFRIRLRP